MGRSKVLVTVGEGAMEPVLEIALRTFVPFAHRHGYDLVVGEGWSDGRPSSWGKVPLMRQLVERYDKVVWFDSDMVIMDASEDIPSPEAGHLVSLARHVHPPERGEVPNCGLWVVRGGQESAEFLDLVWSQVQFKDHRWWEQAAVMHLLGMDPDALPSDPDPGSPWIHKIGVLPSAWNVLYTWPWPERVNAFHFAGMPQRERLIVMPAETWVARRTPWRSLRGPAHWLFRVDRFIRHRRP